MTSNQIRNQLHCMERDGRIDRWREVRGLSGYLEFYVQADNNEWVLYWYEGGEP